MPHQTHDEEWEKQWEEYWDSKNTDHPMPFNAEFEADIPGMRDLNELKGEEWLKEILRFLSRTPAKQEIVEELGKPQNPLEADLLNLKPSNPLLDSIDILSEGDVVKKITINPGKNFDLTEDQVIKMFPDTEHSQNTYDMRNELEIRPPQKKIASIWVGSPLDKTFAGSVSTIIIELNI